MTFYYKSKKKKISIQSIKKATDVIKNDVFELPDAYYNYAKKVETKEKPYLRI
jgi:hypothetical protein